MDHQERHRQLTHGNLSAAGEGVRILPEDASGRSWLDEPGRAGRPAPAQDSLSVRAIKPYEPSLSGNQATSEPASSSPAQPPTPDHARKGPSTCLIVWGTFALLAFACMLLGFATLQGGLSGLSKLTGIIPQVDFGLVTTPTVTIDTSRPSVIERVRAMGRLETVHYELEKVITGKSAGPLPDFLTSDKILLVAHGQVVAGVDLNKLRETDIVVEGAYVTITLPQPEILFSKLDNSKTYVYDRQTGVFSKPDPNLESQMRATAEEQMVLAATEDGILPKARENAEDTLRTLVEGLGYSEVEFKEGP